MTLSPAAAYALDLYHSLHPTSAYCPDPRQAALALPAALDTAPPDTEPGRHEAGMEEGD